MGPLIEERRGVADAERYQISLWWKLAAWYDSVGAIGEAQRRAVDWTFTDDEGGNNPKYSCGTDLCLQTFDFAPIDPESTEYKYYLPGTGFVLAVAMEDGEITGEREELVCVGDSLDVLSDDPECEIDDPEQLLEELCALSPDAFCGD